jgi:2,5-diamino-6-(ribosylamino)-4(3H)-pyrimidinone 5'-phosphate reductase
MDKPLVFVKCAMTVEGKLSTKERKQVKISGSEDLARVDALRAGSDAILVGMNTAVSDDPKLDVKSAQFREERRKKGLSENPMKVAVGDVGRLRMDSDFLDRGGKKVIFSTEKSDPKNVERLREKADVHVLGKTRVDLVEMLRVLSSLNVRRLMVEGGGTTIFEFLKEKLVDELYVAVGPRIFGGRDAPTLAEGVGFSAEDAVKLTLLSVEKVGEAVVLRYRVDDSRKYI